MRALEPTANPLWLKVRRGEKPKTEVELLHAFTGMIRTCEHFDRAKPEGAAPQVVKCHINDILVEATSQSDAREMLEKYWQTHV